MHQNQLQSIWNMSLDSFDLLIQILQGLDKVWVFKFLKAQLRDVDADIFFF